MKKLFIQSTLFFPFVSRSKSGKDLEAQINSSDNSTQFEKGYCV